MNYKFPNYNLHTHSFYCGHGNGSLKDYVEVAKNNKINLLGFSEHCPLKDNRWAFARMNYSMMDVYLSDIELLKKTEKNITLLSSFECDYLPKYDSYYNEIKDKCDYLIFGVHYLENTDYQEISIDNVALRKEHLSIYAKQYIESLQSNLFLIGVHPDIFLSRYNKWDEEAKAISKDIIECAISNDVALEINGKGMLLPQKEGFHKKDRYAYPVDEFWQLASTYSKLKVVSNSDSHTPLNLIKNLEKCINFAKDNSINYSLINVDDIKGIHIY